MYPKTKMGMWCMVGLSQDSTNWLLKKAKLFNYRLISTAATKKSSSSADLLLLTNTILLFQPNALSPTSERRKQIPAFLAVFNMAAKTALIANERPYNAFVFLAPLDPQLNSTSDTCWLLQQIISSRVFNRQFLISPPMVTSDFVSKIQKHLVLPIYQIQFYVINAHLNISEG